MGEILKPIIAAAIREMIARLRKDLGGKADFLPLGFWTKLVPEMTTLIVAGVMNGGKVTPQDVQPFTKKLHKLYREFGLIEVSE